MSRKLNMGMVNELGIRQDRLRASPVRVPRRRPCSVRRRPTSSDNRAMFAAIIRLAGLVRVVLEIDASHGLPARVLHDERLLKLADRPGRRSRRDIAANEF